MFGRRIFLALIGFALCGAGCQGTMLPLTAPSSSTVSIVTGVDVTAPSTIVEIGVGAIVTSAMGQGTDRRVEYHSFVERYPATSFTDSSGNEWFYLLSGDRAGSAIRGFNGEPDRALLASANVVAVSVSPTTHVVPLDVFIIARTSARVWYGERPYLIDAAANKATIDRTSDVIGQFAADVWAWSGGRFALDAKVSVVDTTLSLLSTSYDSDAGRAIILSAGDLSRVLSASDLAIRPEARAVLGVWYIPTNPDTTTGLYTSPCSACAPALLGYTNRVAPDLGDRTYVQVALKADASGLKGYHPDEIFIHEFLHQISWEAALSGSTEIDVDDSGTGTPDALNGWYDRYASLFSIFAAQIDHVSVRPSRGLTKSAIVRPSPEH